MTWDFFSAKKLLEQLLDPLCAWVVVSLLGIVLCLWKPRRFLGTLVILGATLWLTLASLPITGTWLLRLLEEKAGPKADPEALRQQGVTWVVVLGNIREGVKLWKEMGGKKLVVSSGNISTDMVHRARNLGVPEEALVVESDARDTQEQARRLVPLLAGERFVLCTWALHVPRTMQIFRNAGLDPIAAPTDFIAESSSRLAPFRPTIKGLGLTRTALHEHVGRLWLVMNSTVQEKAELNSARHP